MRKDTLRAEEASLAFWGLLSAPEWHPRSHILSTEGGRKASKAKRIRPRSAKCVWLPAYAKPSHGEQHENKSDHGQSNIGGCNVRLRDRCRSEKRINFNERTAAMKTSDENEAYITNVNVT